VETACRGAQGSPGAVMPSGRQAVGSLVLGVKRLGREADHSPPSNAEVKNGGAIPQPPPISSCHSTDWAQRIIYLLCTGKRPLTTER
jgi:hypothetical protein